MKVIDLLNKIANGDHPKKFKLHIYKEDLKYKLSDNGGYYEINTDEEFTESINLIFCLNDEVEIIEEEPRDIDEPSTVNKNTQEFIKKVDKQLKQLEKISNELKKIKERLK